MRLRRAGIVTKIGSPESEAAAARAARALRSAGARVYAVAPASAPGAEPVEDVAGLREARVDLVVTLGGDGTTLRAFRGMDDETPVLAVNVGGNRGILSEVAPAGIPAAVRQIAEGRVILEKRTRLSASCGGSRLPPALNEVLIQRKNLTRTAELEVRFQSDTVRQRMDGVIVATPSGSTGHSFSLGGPILHESLDVLIITPVAPVYRLASIVVPDERVQVICSHDCSVVADAQVVGSAGFGEPITISRHRNRAVFVRLRRRGLRQMSKLGF